MMMNLFEYYNVIKQLNDEKRLIFDDIMYRKKSYPNSPICFLFTRGARTSKFYTL
jgi:hypothetical protein